MAIHVTILAKHRLDRAPIRSQARLIKGRLYPVVSTIVEREGYAPALGAVVMAIGHSSRAAHSDKE